MRLVVVVKGVDEDEGRFQDTNELGDGEAEYCEDDDFCFRQRG